MPFLIKYTYLIFFHGVISSSEKESLFILTFTFMSPKSKTMIKNINGKGQTVHRSDTIEQSQIDRHASTQRTR